jgi:glycosyltransferase involved in cell wall biosynthesis
MNILQLISSGEGFYGAERVVVTLSAELARFGAHVVVGAFRNAAKTPHLEVLDGARRCGLDTSEISCRGRLDWNAVLAIRDLVLRHKVDVIHSHGPKTNLYAYLAARKNGPGLVSTCHLWYCESAIDRLIGMTDRVVLRGFDNVVVVSDTIRQPLCRSWVRKGRIVTIPNGIDCRPFTADGRTTRTPRRWGNGIVVGTAARLSSQKGLPYFLKAAAALLPAFPDATFVVAGDGPDREALQALARGLGIQPHVKFLGSQSDMPAFYSSIDVFVLPSLAEGMPMALIEAMAAAKAVVATSVGSVPLVIQHGDNGLIVEPRDVLSLAGALRQVLEDPELRTRLSGSARRSAESRWSAATMTKHYTDVYDAVIATRRRRLSTTAVAQKAQHPV